MVITKGLNLTHVLARERRRAAWEKVIDADVV
jgi:hypothetical protein